MHQWGQWMWLCDSSPLSTSCITRSKVKELWDTGISGELHFQDLLVEFIKEASPESKKEKWVMGFRTSTEGQRALKLLQSTCIVPPLALLTLTGAL